ncbi:hypothetical protein BP6252_12263 [Coleophoma cylindrospora]|uniref:Essential protein Yae1 N-terminal domain-containing protein n=1 Tax=Coleophoma cylindrospora TaxID=1849047 RepID=A0A3D8QGS8_9HELO|nr:hypothetical protein BP6252_12263 [Coleophoma cylindrospora]
MADPFDEILGLEEQFYDEGYQQGMADGIKAGRIEGRTFGLENGFKKYVENGKLHGKSLVWVNRLASLQPSTNSLQEPSGHAASESSDVKSTKLPVLSENTRLAKHVKTLYALAESDTLSTENTEEAVSDFDDRLKRAQAKAKMVERMVGEIEHDPSKILSSNDGSIEDVSVLSARH